MAPVAATATATDSKTDVGGPETNYPRAPLQLSGILDKYHSIDLTPAIGREYPTIQIRDLLNAPNSDDLLRELAIISE